MTTHHTDYGSNIQDVPDTGDATDELTELRNRLSRVVSILSRVKITGDAIDAERRIFNAIAVARGER